MPPVNQKAADGQRANEPNDLETRTNELENLIAITFGVVAVLISVGFVLHFWLRAFKYLLYWAITMGLMHRLYQGLAGVMWLYRKVRGLQKGRLLSILDEVIGYPKYLSVFTLQMVGIQIGYGPLYDLCPEEWKRGREACKTPEELEQYLAQFVNWAGRSAEEDDGDNLHDDDLGFVNSYDVEYEANPVIFSHLQVRNMQPQLGNLLPVHGNSDRLGAVIQPQEVQSEDTCENDVSSEIKKSQSVSTEQEHQLPIAEASPPAPASIGPATMSVKLSSYLCPDCGEVFNKAFKRSSHMNEIHVHRFRCDRDGCNKTFGNRTNLERHKITHGDITLMQDAYQCSNLWCKTPETRFTRKDNFERHVKRCVAP